MTLLKINLSGQSVVEYFLLTAVVVLLFLGFLRIETFNKVKKSCEKTFDSAVVLITGGGVNDTDNTTNNTTNNTTTS